MHLNELTIKEAMRGLRQKDFSARELVSDCFSKIQESDETLHAFLEVFSENAVREAEKADDVFADSKDGHHPPPLLGIPLAVKDNILLSGERCTAGSRILKNFTAPYDATVIKKLKNQGVVFVGKTNLDEFAMGSSTENSAFGPTKNPIDTTRVPGGSSGGSTTAVASHMCLGALGSDTGGSVRQPSSFCGVVGLKPTYGSVSRHGLIMMASSLDQIGPITKTVDDAYILFSAIAGRDNFDATSTAKTEKEGESSALDVPENLKDVRVGVPKEYFGRGLDHDVKKIIMSAIKKMEDAGADVKEVSLPHAEYTLACYHIVVPAEISANLARFDGIRYGYSDSAAETLFDVYSRSRAFGFGDEVKRRIMLGTYALSSGYYDAYYLKAQKVRRLIKQDFEKVFAEVDILAGPTAPTPAFKFGEKTQDPLQMYLEDIYTVPANLSGVLALSIPAGFVTREGVRLPVGLQITGGWFEERKLLSLASLVENLLAV